MSLTRRPSLGIQLEHPGCEEPKANCFSVQAVLDFARENQIFSGGIMLLPVLLSAIFAKASNDRNEVKAIKDSLDKAVAELAGQNKEVIPRLLATVDKIARIS